MSQSLAERLWDMMDVDKNGIVDEDEFLTALNNMMAARSWLRYCPTCLFDNQCDYCKLVAKCPDCSRETWCPKHWQEHPFHDIPEGADEE